MTTPDPLVRTRIRVEQDVFAVRQLGREVGRLVGLEAQDQIRLATALSEVGRLLVAEGRDTDVVFATTPDGLPYIGTHRRYPRHLFALGYGGNGMTFGFLAARMLLRRVLDGPSDDDEWFGFGRVRPRSRVSAFRA